ncbi:MAG: amino acid ABC transporter permease [Chloroflexi bacterium]|nr:amino acid ABC transporter permease [Chloroflexota bacterium]MCC6891286.1 amino acid ABC transporter permease [Anaerolineae bacterium]
MNSTVPSAEPTPPLQPPQLLNLQGFARNLLQKRVWFLLFILLDILVLNAIATQPEVTKVWDYVVPGLAATIRITVFSFVVAVVIGLIVAFGRISKNIIIYNLSTLYVEIFRGLPLLVIILIFNFVLTPAIIDVVVGSNPDQANMPFVDDLIQRLIGVPGDQVSTTVLRTRDIDAEVRIVLAFAVTYGAFMSEVFRAGIESIGRGQVEAGRSLGMTYVQVMYYIILPQAIRNVLPALANNFVFLLKDTSLASAVAVPEISYLTRQYSSNNFRYPEGLLVLSFLYANLTIVLSMASVYLENRLHKDRMGAR